MVTATPTILLKRKESSWRGVKSQSIMSLKQGLNLALYISEIFKILHYLYCFYI